MASTPKKTKVETEAETTNEAEVAEVIREEIPTGPFEVVKGTNPPTEGIEPQPQFVNLATETREEMEVQQPNPTPGKPDIALTIQKF
jgi:hypothetical protein